MKKVWNTMRTTYKVGDFIGWYKDSALNLNPDFQRRSVWKQGAKSLFIDTLIKGYPVPIIFLRDLKPNLRTFTQAREVVDGQQRIRTLVAYISPKLLKDFTTGRDDFRIWKDHNREFAGKSFGELPDDVQSRILDYQFSVNVFPSDTDDREVKQVFSRMNATGYKLNSQELRNAEFFGAFKTVAERLATEQLNRWRSWRIFSIDGLARMGEVELTSELMIVMLEGVSEKNDKHISKVYDDFDRKFPASVAVSRRFRRVMDFIENRLDETVPVLFRKRTMFYALFCAIYDRMYGLDSELGLAGPKRPTTAAVTAIESAARRIVDGTAPKEVMDATTRRTSHVRERNTLVKFLLRRA